MQDTPDSHKLLEGVIRFLRETVLPQLDAQAGYEARIAGSLLQIVQRQIGRPPARDASELASLRALLPETGDDLPGLNQVLCEHIADGRIAWDDASLLRHLWTITLDKLAVDQPGYSTYRRSGRP